MKRFFALLAKARTIKALNLLSDRQLEDIGVKRGDIRAHAEKIYENLLESWARRDQLRKELHSMSDRELGDIGISRYEISRVVDATL